MCASTGMTAGQNEHPLMWKLLATLFLLFPSIPCDDTEFHLYNYLNHSVSPCSDFYSHVCATGMSVNQTVRYKSEQFYRDLAVKLHARSRNSPLMNAISSARKGGNCTFNARPYSFRLQQRCGLRLYCYLEEFYYFFEIYSRTADKVDEQLAFFAAQASMTFNIPRLIDVTSRVIELTILDSEKDGAFDIVVAPYEKLLDRLAIMTVLRQTKTDRNLGLGRLRNMAMRLKESIANMFIATPWLRERNGFGMDRLSQFLSILGEITIMTDFDELDANLNVWRRMEQFITEKYFEYSRRSTGCHRFDVIHPLVTAKSEMERNVATGLDWQVFTRFTEGLVYNAFNGIELNAVVLLAPIFYPIMAENSSDTTVLGFAAVFAHEMFHSFIKPELTTSSAVFNREADCMMHHFNASCGVWAESKCSSGVQTFEEDGPDVEGLRAAYDLLRRTYSQQQLKSVEYEDLVITREQAFFYAFGMRLCSAFDDDPRDEHSSDKVRLNALVSMLPEFSGAFGCHAGDEEYAQANASCYLFGPQSGMQRDGRSRAK